MLPQSALKESILLLNRYCAKLPSDTFTRLTPLYNIKHVEETDSYLCTLQLPINSPLRRVVVGRMMKDRDLAARSAALEACIELRYGHPTQIFFMYAFYH